LALGGETDRMVTIARDRDDPYRCHLDSAPLVEIANRQQLVPDAYLSPDGRATTADFRRYALPLLGPDALPTYSRLDAPRVSLRDER
jgi:hypothetical protein